MRLHHSTALVVLAATLSACAQRDLSFCSDIAPSRPIPVDPLQQVVFAGDEVRLKIGLILGRVCFGEAEDLARVRSVAAELYGPDGLPLEVATTAPAGDGKATWTSTVTFSTSALGNYHLVASLDPGFGLVQTDVAAVVDRLDALSEVVTTTSWCERLWRTPLGATLCSPGSNDINFTRAPNPTRRYFGRGEVAGNTVWVQEAGALRRYVDTGAAEPEAAGSLPIDQYTRLLFATESEALLWSYYLVNTLNLVRYENGTLSIAASRRLGDEVEPLRAAFDPATGGVVLESKLSWTRFFDWSATEPLHWSAGSGRAYKAADGVWFAVDGQVTFLPAERGVPVLASAIPPGWTLAYPQESERPVFASVRNSGGAYSISYERLLVPLVQGDRVVLALYANLGDVTTIEARAGALRLYTSGTNYLLPLP